MSEAIKWEDIEKANQEAEAIPLRGKNYVMVNQKVKAFRKVYPCGQVDTDLVSLEKTDKGKYLAIFRATVRDEEGNLLGSGWAKEEQGSSTVNRTSWLENAETGAIGRAMSACGFGIDASYSSADEVILAENQREEQDRRRKAASKPKTAKDYAMHYYKKAGVDVAKLAEDYGVTADTTEERWKEIARDIKDNGVPETRQEQKDG